VAVEAVRLACGGTGHSCQAERSAVGAWLASIDQPIGLSSCGEFGELAAIGPGPTLQQS
jgi:hypothetical protein